MTLGTDHLRYLRRRGNRRVRARRRRRSALRVVLIAALWTTAAITAATATVLGARWATSTSHFHLGRIDVRGLNEARVEEIRDLVAEWRQENLLNINLSEVEARIRTHPWIGTTGLVRIQRRMPDTLLITVGERIGSGVGLVDGEIWLLDERGAPIDRYGPRYAGYDYPIITGLDVFTGSAREGIESPLRQALRTGVAVTQILTRDEPVFYNEVSEIDVSAPSMVVLRLEGRDYDVRLSPEETLRNLHNYLSLRERLAGSEKDIEYVDLRWKGRIAVWPAEAVIEQDGGG